LGHQKYTAIIFDLDGTLLRVEDIKKHGDEIIKKTLNDFNVKRTRSEDRIRFWFSGGGFLNLLRKWGIKSESDKRSFLDTLNQNEYNVKKRLIESGKVRPYKDSDILNTLGGDLKLGLVTNSSSKTVSFELSRFNLRKYFTSTIALGDFANNLRPKPDPDGILQCLKEMGEAPSKSIVVGDSLTDIIAGNRSQANTALLIREEKSEKRQNEEPVHARIDFKLRSLKELEDIIR
jgi:HAD superfamily hydrolase (TIGR01509 family)